MLDHTKSKKLQNNRYKITWLKKKDTWALFQLWQRRSFVKATALRQLLSVGFWRCGECSRVPTARSALTLSGWFSCSYSVSVPLAARSPRSCCLLLQASLCLCGVVPQLRPRPPWVKQTLRAIPIFFLRKQKEKTNNCWSKIVPFSHVLALCIHVCKCLKSYSGACNASPTQSESTANRLNGVGFPLFVAEVELSHWNGGVPHSSRFVKSAWGKRRGVAPELR